MSVKTVLKDRQSVHSAADCISVSRKATLIRLKQLKIANIRSDREYPGSMGINTPSMEA